MAMAGLGRALQAIVGLYADRNVVSPARDGRGFALRPGSRQSGHAGRAASRRNAGRSSRRPVGAEPRARQPDHAALGAMTLRRLGARR